MKTGDMNFGDMNFFPEQNGDMKHFTEQSLRIYSLSKWFVSPVSIFIKHFVPSVFTLLNKMVSPFSLYVKNPIFLLMLNA